MTTLLTITEGTTPTYTAILKDNEGVVVPAASLSAVRLRLYSTATGAVINSRNGQNVLNANNVTINNVGLLTWKLLEADTILVDSPKPILGHHCAVFVIEWTDAQSVLRQIVHEVTFPIQRADYAPFAPTP